MNPNDPPQTPPAGASGLLRATGARSKADAAPPEPPPGAAVPPQPSYLSAGNPPPPPPQPQAAPQPSYLGGSSAASAGAGPAGASTGGAGAADGAKAKAAEVFEEVKSGFSSTRASKEPYGLFAFGAAAATLMWLIWLEDGKPGFWSLGLWTTFILASLALIFAPMVRGAFSLSPSRAHQLATAGACGMAFVWIAFLLPDIQSNRSFFGTFAAAFAGIAAWMAPGRPGVKTDDDA